MDVCPYLITIQNLYFFSLNRYTIECRHSPSQFGLFGNECRYILAKDPEQPLVQQFDLATGEHRRDIETSVGHMHITPNGLYAGIVDHVSKKSIKVRARTTILPFPIKHHRV